MGREKSKEGVSALYNRYLSAARADVPCAHDPQTAPEPPGLHNSEPPHTPPKAQPASMLSGLGDALSGRLRNLHFDLDTLIVIIAVYFLIADTDDFDIDLLVLIGVLFVLGF